MITFDIPAFQVFTLLASTVFPLLVGLVTTRETSGARKAIYLAALAWGSQLATELTEALRDGTSYNLGMALVLGLASFLVAVGIHYGLWKATGATAKTQNLLRTSPTPGISQQYGDYQTYGHSAVDIARHTATVRKSDPADRVPDGPDHRA